MVFGVLSVYVALRSRYPGELTFAREELIDLFDSVVKNLSDLHVLFRGAPATPNLILLRGAIMNTGRRDVTIEMVERPLVAQLPDGYRWLAVNIVTTSQNVNASLEISKDSREVVFSMGMLRCREFIRFQALGEVPLGAPGVATRQQESIRDQFRNALSFQHRIADTAHVKTTTVGRSQVSTKRMRYLVSFFIVNLVLCLVLGLLILIGLAPANLNYSIQTHENEIQNVEIHPKSDGLIRVKSLNGDYDAKLSVDEFSKALVRIDGVRPDSGFMWALGTLFLIYTVGSGLLSILLYREHRQRRRLRALLAISPQE